MIGFRDDGQFERAIESLDSCDYTEAGIRRVTVTIHWQEGSHARDMMLQQYITNPSRSGVPGASSTITPSRTVTSTFRCPP